MPILLQPLRDGSAEYHQVNALADLPEHQKEVADCDGRRIKHRHWIEPAIADQGDEVRARYCRATYRLSHDATRVFKRDGKRLVIAGLRPDVAEAVTSTPQPHPAPPASSSEATQEEAQPEEKEEMKTLNRIEHVSTETANSAQVATSAFDQVRIHLENVKEKLRGVVTDVNQSLKLLPQAHKERRATEKEIEEVRETLQSLQKIRI